ncbi:MAG: DUF6807 family protein [Planctomycetota bacterium]|jgi:hypothetical protein
MENIGFKSISQIIMYSVFCIILLLFSTSYASMEKDKAEIVLGTFTVEAGNYDRINTPIRFQCSPSEIFGDFSKLRRPDYFYYIDDGADLAMLRDYHLVLIEQRPGGTGLAVQWEGQVDFTWEKASKNGAIVWILEGKMKKKTRRSFKLVLEKGPVATGPFTIEDISNKSLLVKCSGREVLRYNYGIIQEIEGKTGPYDRSSYLHPVWTPTGKVITGDFSLEHIHQRGIFLAWTKAIFGEVETEFWGLGKSAGRILADDLGPSVFDGPVFARLVIYNKGQVGDRIYFKEIWVVRVYALSKEDIWLFDVDISQVPTDPQNPHRPPKKAVSMVLPKVYYGGMSFRGPSEWLRYKSKDVARAIARGAKFKDAKWLSPNVSLDVLTDKGGDRKSGDRNSARWIDYTGPLGNDWGGLVMFDHPSNPRYPTPLRVHPELPYFCYAFVQNESYTVSSNGSLNLTYRFLIHSGHPRKRVNERFARDFVEPPKASWKRAK